MGFQYLAKWTMFVILLIQLHSYEALGCLARMKTELLKLKASIIQGLNVSALSSWRDEESDCCGWEGVGCDNEGKRVTQLWLNGLMKNPLSNKPLQVGEKDGFLRGNGWSLNASLFLPFEDLQVLDLSSNFLAEITGVLKLNNLQALHLQQNCLSRAPTLSSLPLLKILDASRNNLEEFPDSQGLCQLRNIQELDLRQNKIKGNLPQCLSNLTFLSFLELSENNLGGTIPQIFHSLSSLEYISLSHNCFNGSFSFSSLSNNSKLLVFDLTNSDNHHHLEIETESPPWVPPFQLKILRLSNCTLNKPTGLVPSFLWHQRDLVMLELSRVKMRGRVPTWLLVNNTGLEILNLEGNFLAGPLEFERTSQIFLNLTWLDVSDNSINTELRSDIGFVLPNLVSLNLARNELHGNIPASLCEMRILRYLDLSSNSFLGTLPEDLDIECSSVSLQKLPDNGLNALGAPPKSNLKQLYSFLFHNNLFTEGITNGLLANSSLQYLDLSRNFLSGKLPDWIGNLSRLNALVLSDNLLEGPIPNGLCNLSELNLLDLSNNKFNHTMPYCSSLPNLKYLHLQNNELSGPIPYVLSNASSLRALDLRGNKLSGEIPGWISSLSNLKFLLLKDNLLEGPIPSQLCHLLNVSLLDLSHNHLSGEIPACLSVKRRKSQKNRLSHLYDGLFVFSTYSVSSNLEIHYTPFFEYIKVTIDFSMSTREEKIEFVSKNRPENYTGYILEFMSGLDLSCNDLTGSIPPELGHLSNIRSLNLSRNNLSGLIPETFSSLGQIESLDLSHNMLSGQIPSQLTELTSLSFFSVAYNNLSGMTPGSKNQFATFGQENFEGNPLLCGLPLKTKCKSDGSSSQKDQVSDFEEDESIRDGFFGTFVASFGVAFLLSLLFSLRKLILYK